MRCAITGAAGYVGSAIARAARARGWDVVSLGRRRAADAVEHVPFDLAEGARNIPWRGIDALVHAAYDFTPRGWPAVRAINVEGSIRLLRAAKENGVARTVFISSMSAFPGCVSNYGKAKLEIEAAALELGGAVVRPGLVHGG